MIACLAGIVSPGSFSEFQGDVTIAEHVGRLQNRLQVRFLLAGVQPIESFQKRPYGTRQPVSQGSPVTFRFEPFLQLYFARLCSCVLLSFRLIGPVKLSLSHNLASEEIIE